MVIREEKWKVSRLKILLLVLLVIAGVSIPVHGKESSLKVRGNIADIEEQISNMEADYWYLEAEIHRLLAECY